MIINPGDTVRISSCGLSITGVVDSVMNYPTQSGEHVFYIEMTSKDGCHYWKEDQDGGTIEVIKTKEIK